MSISWSLISIPVRIDSFPGDLNFPSLSKSLLYSNEEFVASSILDGDWGIIIDDDIAGDDASLVFTSIFLVSGDRSEIFSSFASFGLLATFTGLFKLSRY